MATKKEEGKDLEVKQQEEAAELMAEVGAEQLVTGVEELELAGDLAADATGELAAGASDLTRAEDALSVAERLSDLSGVIATAGVVDMTEGAQMLAASDDIATISALVGLMGEEDLEQGLVLARLAGELQAVSKVVDLMVMPVLTAFLDNRSAQLQDLAVDNILQSAGNRALARVLAAKRLEIEEMGVEEMAEGLARIARTSPWPGLCWVRRAWQRWSLQKRQLI